MQGLELAERTGLEPAAFLLTISNLLILRMFLAPLIPYFPQIGHLNGH